MCFFNANTAFAHHGLSTDDQGVTPERLKRCAFVKTALPGTSSKTGLRTKRFSIRHIHAVRKNSPGKTQHGQPPLCPAQGSLALWT